MSPAELNAQCTDRLLAADLGQRLAVIGSGPSSPFIAPIEELERLLCARCGLAKEPNDEFWVFSQKAYDRNAVQYFQVIRDTYDKTPHWTSHLYEHIVRLPVKGFATFNYDTQLPDQFRRLHPDSYLDGFSVYPPRDDQTCAWPQEFLGSQQLLVALHGYCDPENNDWEKQIILRLSDYNDHYTGSVAPLFAWWREMLLTLPCVFIGTSLKEPGLHRVIKYLLERSPDRLVDKGHLHLVPMRSDTGYPPAGKSLSVIDQLFFDPLDSRYSGLLSVLSAFSGLPIDSPSPRIPAPKPITLTETFDF